MQEQALIDLYFDGDRGLYEEYKALCREQFKLDATEGDRACDRGDTEALRRLAHSLKTVLRSLGKPELSELAFAVEDASAGRDMGAALVAWQTLRRGLMSALD
jgi:HPt (histidine-containing phosphotransfer) domain-containing protein